MTIDEEAKELQNEFAARMSKIPLPSRAIADDVARELVPEGWDYLVHETMRSEKRFVLVMIGYRGKI